MSMNGYAKRLPGDVVDAIIRGDRDPADVKDQDEGPVTQFEKLWQALHFVLSGTAWESDGALGELFMGGHECGSDLGYGPGRVHAPADVARLHAQLEALSDDALFDRLDPDALAKSDLYPDIGLDDPESLFEEVEPYLRRLRKLLQSAAAAGDGLLIWIA